MRLSFPLVLAGLVLAAWPPPPAAAEPSFMQRVAIYRACKPDLDRLCPDAGRDRGRVEACLRQNARRLAEACVGAIRAAGVRE